MNQPSRFSCHLANRGVIRVAGDDRRTFLQGLISNDINLCAPGQAIYAALLTPQGKFLHDMFVVDTGDDFLIDCEAERADDLVKRLSTYKLRSKVTIENVNSDYDVWAMWGNGVSSMPKKKNWIYNDPRLPELGIRLIASDFAAEKPVDFTTYDMHRVAMGVPDGSRDMIVEKSTLLECNLDLLNAISWMKGCYMGQELTARTHYRGLVKKRLFPVKIIGAAPDTGSVIYADTEKAGEMRSSCGDVGLALLSIEKAQAALRDGASFSCGESRLAVYRPWWLEIKE